MKRALPFFVLLLSAASFAQTFVSRTDTFTFDQTTAITSYDGSDPANPPYPGDMGAINLSTPNQGIAVPWNLGYLNNGYLVPCNPIAWGTKVWTIGDGTHNGDQYQIPGSTSCPYFTGEYGTSGNSNKTYDSFSVVATYTTKLVRSCGRFGCHTFPQYSLASGTGTLVQVVTP